MSNDNLKPTLVATSSIRRIAGNAVSIGTSDVVNRATTLVLYTVVARRLGALEFGQMSLALTLFYSFQLLAVLGLGTLVTREVARNRTKTEEYLGNGSIVVAVSSLLSMIILLLFVRLMNYATDTASIIVLLSLGLLPYSLSAVCEAVFQAWEQMHYIAYAQVPVNIAKVGLAFLILSRGYGLYHLVILLVASYVAIAGVEWGFMLQHITKSRLRIDSRFCLTMIRSTSTFLGIKGVAAIRGSLTVVLLSKLAGEIEVGFYNAASQLMVPAMLVYESTVLSVFPMMCKRFEASLQSLKRISEHLLELLLAIAVPTVIGLLFLADPALLLLYGEEDFLLASGALRIMVWMLILQAFTQVLGRVLLASLREKVTLRIVVIDVLVNLFLGLPLISQFGLIGAALARLLTAIIDFLQHYVPVSRLLTGIALRSVVWKPVVAGACMAVYLALVRGQGVLLTVVSAGLLYAGVLLVLEVWSAGGPRQLKTRYLYPWSESVSGQEME